MSTDHAETAARLGVDQEWRAGAACAGRPEVMDPTGDQIAAAKRHGIERELWRPALEICWACPVYGQCRAWVLSLPRDQDVSGVCGGLTEDERAKKRRRRPGHAAASKAAARGNWDRARAARSAEADERYHRYLELSGQGRTREQIADRLGVSTTSVRRYEARERKERR